MIKDSDKYNCVWRNADWPAPWHISTKSYQWQWKCGCSLTSCSGHLDMSWKKKLPDNNYRKPDTGYRIATGWSISGWILDIRYIPTMYSINNINKRRSLQRWSPHTGKYVNSLSHYASKSIMRTHNMSATDSWCINTVGLKKSVKITNLPPISTSFPGQWYVMAVFLFLTNVFQIWQTNY